MMSTFSRSSTRWANEMSGAYAHVSASAPASVIERRNALIRSSALRMLEDLLDDGAVLALELARLDGRKVLVGPLLDLDAQTPEGIGVRRADHGAMQAGEGDGLAASGEADAIGNLGHGADLRVLVLVLRDEQDAILVACVDRQGDGHAREHHRVLERNEQQVAQNELTLQSMY